MKNLFMLTVLVSAFGMSSAFASGTSEESALNFGENLAAHTGGAFCDEDGKFPTGDVQTIQQDSTGATIEGL